MLIEVPLPPAAGLIVPDTLNERFTAKLTPLTLTPPEMTTDRLAGVNVTPLLVGVTV